MSIFDRVRIEFEENVVEESPIFDGNQIELKFENGYGASLINHFGSYGNEIPVLFFDGDENMGITYSTDITDDVLGHLEDEEVIEALNKIRSLDENGRLVRVK
jgi:hypothetical protein